MHDITDLHQDAYTFLFEPNPDWSHFYAPATEIRAYIKRTSDKYGLAEKVIFNSKVQEAIWDEATGKWNLKIEQNGQVIEDTTDILVHASGFLNKVKMPNIPGINNFKGKLMHTATWYVSNFPFPLQPHPSEPQTNNHPRDESYDYTNKRIAVIGNGSSGIQAVTALSQKATKLVNFIRNPTWISINFLADKSRTGANFAYTEEEKELFRSDPKAHFKLRRELEASVNAFFFGMYTGHPFQQGLEGICRQQMEAKLEENPALAKRLIPEFHPGCRRLTPGDGYLEAFYKDSVVCNWDPIVEITEKGIRTKAGANKEVDMPAGVAVAPVPEGTVTEEEFDLIVCATGFDTSFIPPWKMIGRKGADLAQMWKSDPEAFCAVQVADMPNYFVFNGPNCPIAHGSVLTQVSWTADYILKWADKMARQDIKSITPSDKSVRDWNVYTQLFLKRTVFGDKCRSWYKNGKMEGKVTGVYPGSILHFKEVLARVGAEAFDVEWNHDNMWTCLGNGESERDQHGMGDLAYYMDEMKV